MSLGVLTYKLVEFLKKVPGHLVSLIETGCLVYSCYVLRQGFCIEDFKVLILFPVLIGCAMTGKGIISKLMDNQLSGWLGSISYELYLNHLLISTALTMFWKDMPYHKALLVYLASIFMLAITMHLFLHRVKRCICRQRRKWGMCNEN